MKNEKIKKILIYIGKFILAIIAVLICTILSQGLIGMLLSNIPTPIRKIVQGIIYLSLGILFLYLLRKFIDKKTLFSVGFEIKGRVRDIFMGTLLGIITVAIGFVIIYVIEKPQIDTFIRINFIAAFFVLSVCTALFEEMFMRGYILNNLLDICNKYIAVLIAAFPFVILHLFNSHISVIPVLTIFLGSVLLGLIYIQTKNLWFVTVFHLFFNFTQAMLGFNVSGGESPSIIQPQLPDNLLTGGEFGFEGSYICVIILSICILYFAQKKVKNVFYKKI